MSERNIRSRSLRRVKVTTPGSRNTTHYEKRKPKKAHCSDCGKVLSGVARATPDQMKKLSKTEKRPQRPYGGVLCTQCMRKKMVTLAQNIKLE